MVDTKTAIATELEVRGTTIHITGLITLKTVPQLRAEAVSLFTSQAHLEFDLEGVVGSDSAALALLTTWIREAKKQHKSIAFIHLPQQLIDMAHLSGLEKLLKVSSKK